MYSDKDGTGIHRLENLIMEILRFIHAINLKGHNGIEEGTMIISCEIIQHNFYHKELDTVDNFMKYH